MLQFTIPAVMCASGSICCGTPFITHVYRRKELNPGTDLSVTVQGTYLDLRDMEWGVEERRHLCTLPGSHINNVMLHLAVGCLALCFMFRTFWARNWDRSASIVTEGFRGFPRPLREMHRPRLYIHSTLCNL